MNTKRLLCILLLVLLSGVSISNAKIEPTVDELQTKINRQEQQINDLERQVDNLESQKQQGDPSGNKGVWSAMNASNIKMENIYSYISPEEQQRINRENERLKQEEIKKKSFKYLLIGLLILSIIIYIAYKNDKKHNTIAKKKNLDKETIAVCNKQFNEDWENGNMEKFLKEYKKEHPEDFVDGIDTDTKLK